jgi:hypothetical protein
MLQKSEIAVCLPHGQFSNACAGVFFGRRALHIDSFPPGGGTAPKTQGRLVCTFPKNAGGTWCTTAARCRKLHNRFAVSTVPYSAFPM